jgi:hypothetical protein
MIDIHGQPWHAALSPRGEKECFDFIISLSKYPDNLFHGLPQTGNRHGGYVSFIYSLTVSGKKTQGSHNKRFFSLRSLCLAAVNAFTPGHWDRQVSPFRVDRNALLCYSFDIVNNPRR